MGKYNQIVLESIGGLFTGKFNVGIIDGSIVGNPSSTQTLIERAAIFANGSPIDLMVMDYLNTHTVTEGQVIEYLRFSSTCHMDIVIDRLYPTSVVIDLNVYTTSNSTLKYKQGARFFLSKDVNDKYYMNPSDAIWYTCDKVDSGKWIGYDGSGNGSRYYFNNWGHILSHLIDSSLAEYHEVVTFPGEESGSGGGTGTFDGTGDSIDFPSVPTLSAVSAGFITLYAPTITQLNSLAEFMWSDNFDIDTFKKLFADPMDVIIGLSIVPVSVPISGEQEVKVGFISTGVSMNKASGQYVTVDCGELTVKEFFGSALDYSPYTKFSIYMPYIGTREISTDDIMKKTLHLIYRIDILSGSVTAILKSDDSVLYQFSGSCAVSIPVASQDFTNLLTASIQLAGAGIVSAATGSVSGLVSGTANMVTSAKPNIQRSGAVSGAAGMLGVQTPYLIAQIPRQSLAAGYNKFVGYPCNISAQLSSLSGFTKVENIHLDNISGTKEEVDELNRLLMEGVFL